MRLPTGTDRMKGVHLDTPAELSTPARPGAAQRFVAALARQGEHTGRGAKASDREKSENEISHRDEDRDRGVTRPVWDGSDGPISSVERYNLARNGSPVDVPRDPSESEVSSRRVTEVSGEVTTELTPTRTYSNETAQTSTPGADQRPGQLHAVTGTPTSTGADPTSIGDPGAVAVSESGIASMAGTPHIGSASPTPIADPGAVGPAVASALTPPALGGLLSRGSNGVVSQGNPTHQDGRGLLNKAPDGEKVELLPARAGSTHESGELDVMASTASLASTAGPITPPITPPITGAAVTHPFAAGHTGVVSTVTEQLEGPITAMAQPDGPTELEIELHPAQLGIITLHCRRDGDHTEITIYAQRQPTAAALSDAAHDLSTLLAAQGIAATVRPETGFNSTPGGRESTGTGNQSPTAAPTTANRTTRPAQRTSRRSSGDSSVDLLV